jgi:hypothetical protein
MGLDRRFAVSGGEGAVGMAVDFNSGRRDYFVLCDKPGAGLHFERFSATGPVTYIQTEGKRVVTSAPLGDIEDLSNTTVRHKF